MANFFLVEKPSQEKLRMICFVPAYCPSIAYMARLREQETIGLYVGSNYQKQTYRNRCKIHGANGVLQLSIPIVHQKNGSKQKDNQVQIFQESRWKKEHWKSIEAAYRSSPYFEFYEDDFAPFFQRDTTGLMEFNSAIIQQLVDVLDWNKTLIKVDSLPEDHSYSEALLNAKIKDEPTHYPKYTQVFENKNGFLPNLSILDLLFNLGPETDSYLEQLPKSSDF